MDFRFLKRRKSLDLFFGLLVATLGIALLPISIFDVRDAYLLENPATTRITQGRILNLHSSSGRSGTWYYIDYAYTVGPLAIRVRPFQISQENWQELRGENFSLQVRYLVDHPTVSEPTLPGQEGFDVRTNWFFLICSIFLTLLGYWGALFSKRGQYKKDSD
jgi:hypothetical protein